MAFVDCVVYEFSRRKKGTVVNNKTNVEILVPQEMGLRVFQALLFFFRTSPMLFGGVPPGGVHPEPFHWRLSNGSNNGGTKAGIRCYFQVGL